MMPTLRQIIDQPDLAVLLAGGPGSGCKGENCGRKPHEVLKDKGWQKTNAVGDGDSGIYKHASHPGTKVVVDDRYDSWKVAKGGDEEEGRGGDALAKKLAASACSCKH